jgi:hypothetical protein
VTSPHALSVVSQRRSKEVGAQVSQLGEVRRLCRRRWRRFDPSQPKKECERPQHKASARPFSACADACRWTRIGSRCRRCVSRRKNCRCWCCCRPCVVVYAGSSVASLFRESDGGRRKGDGSRNEVRIASFSTEPPSSFSLERKGHQIAR